MLGADVSVIKRFGFFARQRQDLLDARRIGDRAHDFLVRPGADFLFHLQPDGFQIQAQTLQYINRHPLPQLDQP